MKKQELFWQTYLNIEKSIVDLSRYIFFTDVIISNQDGAEVEQSCDSQLKTFSPYIADLLIQTCVQIEAISKELYFDIGGVKKRGDISLFFDEDCLKEIDIKWKTHEKRVMITTPLFNFTKNENIILRPLKEAHKRQGTYWEKAYQAVKHDRYISVSKGNIKALLHAAAALYLLNIYFRNEKWTVSYNNVSKVDVSLGSLIFSVESPTVGQLWNDNMPIKTTSPYIVVYKDEYYKKIKSEMEEENKALQDYWLKQPELNEPAFQKQLAEAAKVNDRLMGIWELGKYRMNQKITSNLPFEEKKKMLLNSVEWNGWIHQHNTHLCPDEISEDNIQEEIDKVGLHMGMEIMKKFQKLAWVNDAMNSEWCEISIG